MFFILLVFFAAFTIEGVGTYVSILGLSDTFKGDPVVLGMAIILDFTKLVLISLLYKHWTSVLGRSLLIPAAAVMMIITSTGVAGYMSGSFQKAMAPNTEISVKLKSYQSEHERLITRKAEMDKQITQMPENYITARQRLMKSFKPELDRINSRIIELDQKILDLKTNSVQADAHLGPVVLLANVFGVELGTAVSIIIGLIVFVFDPIAVLLVLNGNMLIERRGEKRKDIEAEKLKLEREELHVKREQLEREAESISREIEESKNLDFELNQISMVEEPVNPDAVIKEDTDESHAVLDDLAYFEPDDEAWEEFKASYDEENKDEEPEELDEDLDEPDTSINEVEDLQKVFDLDEDDDEDEDSYVVMESLLDDYKMNSINPDIEFDIFRTKANVLSQYSKDTFE